MFSGIFVEISQHQQGYLIYLPSTWKIVSSHEILFDEINPSALAYTPRLYSEALMTQPAVSFLCTLHHIMENWQQYNFCTV